MPHDDDENPVKPMSPEEKELLFGIPAKPAPSATPPAPMPHREEKLELAVDRAAAAAPQVLERIRVGGPAVLVRVFVFSAALALLLFEGLRRVYRH